MSFIRLLSGTPGTAAQSLAGSSASPVASSLFGRSNAREVCLSDYKDKPISVHTRPDPSLMSSYDESFRTASPPLPAAADGPKPLVGRVAKVKKTVSFSPQLEQIYGSPVPGSTASAAGSSSAPAVFSGARPVLLERNATLLMSQKKTVIRLPQKRVVTPAVAAASMTDQEGAGVAPQAQAAAGGPQAPVRATPAFTAKRVLECSEEAEDDSDDEEVRELARSLAHTRLGAMSVSSNGKFLGNASESEEG